jgi:hypothetical protein
MTSFSGVCRRLNRFLGRSFALSSSSSITLLTERPGAGPGREDDDGAFAELEIDDDDDDIAMNPLGRDSGSETLKPLWFPQPWFVFEYELNPL